MKCRLDGDESCRRCRQAGVPCVFVPRANAAASTARTSPSSHSTSQSTSAGVLQRLIHIETLLGITGSATGAEAEGGDSEDETREGDGQHEDPQYPLRSAVEDLRKVAPGCVNAIIWRRSTVQDLWSR